MPFEFMIHFAVKVSKKGYLDTNILVSYLFYDQKIKFFAYTVAYQFNSKAM